MTRHRSERNLEVKRQSRMIGSGIRRPHKTHFPLHVASLCHAAKVLLARDAGRRAVVLPLRSTSAFSRFPLVTALCAIPRRSLPLGLACPKGSAIGEPPRRGRTDPAAG